MFYTGIKLCLLSPLLPKWFETGLFYTGIKHSLYLPLLSLRFEARLFYTGIKRAEIISSLENGFEPVLFYTGIKLCVRCFMDIDWFETVFTKMGWCPVFYSELFDEDYYNQVSYRAAQLYI